MATMYAVKNKDLSGLVYIMLVKTMAMSIRSYKLLVKTTLLAWYPQLMT